VIILWILAAIFAVILAIIFVPIKYIVVADVAEKTNVYVRVSWFFRAVRFIYENNDGIEKSEFRVFFFRIGKRKKKPRPQKKSSSKTISPAPQKIEEKFTKESPSKFLHVLTDSNVKTIIKPIMATAKKILRLMMPKYLDISGTVGLPCPFETGLLFGTYETLAGIFGIRNKVRFAGEFNTDVFVFNMKAKVRGKASVLRMAVPVIGLVMQKPVRIFIKEAFK
jgi:hypothetical protein